MHHFLPASGTWQNWPKVNGVRGRGGRCPSVLFKRLSPLCVSSQPQTEPSHSGEEKQTQALLQRSWISPCLWSTRMRPRASEQVSREIQWEREKALGKGEETWIRNAKKLSGVFIHRRTNKRTKVALVDLKECPLGWPGLSTESGDCSPPLSPFRSHHEWEDVGWPCFLK